MLLEVAVKWVHFACIFAIVSSIVGEHLLLKEQMTRKEIYRLSRLDAIYGVSAIVLLAAGMTLWFGLGKPAEYYSLNWIFHLKIGLFVVVGLLSIYPTVFFMQHRKGYEGELEAISIIPFGLQMCLLAPYFVAKSVT